MSKFKGKRQPIIKPYSEVPVIKSFKKKKRAPLGKFKVYEKFNARNKTKFFNASNNGKREMLEKYKVNPRNTDSGSYAVDGIEPKMHSFYNMLPDRHKTIVLKRPLNERMKMVNFLYAEAHKGK